MIVGPSIAAEEDVRLEEGRWIRGILPGIVDVGHSVILMFNGANPGKLFQPVALPPS
jgi:hypothetical protein